LTLEGQNKLDALLSFAYSTRCDRPFHGERLRSMGRSLIAGQALLRRETEEPIYFLNRGESD